jgi:hypothetical protein
MKKDIKDLKEEYAKNPTLKKEIDRLYMVINYTAEKYYSLAECLRDYIPTIIKYNDLLRFHVICVETFQARLEDCNSEFKRLVAEAMLEMHTVALEEKINEIIDHFPGEEE